MKIEFVSATRLNKKLFWEKSALGQSLRRLEPDPRVTSFITFENRLALPLVFNARIDSAKSGDILVFVHDDVWLDDYFIVDRIIDGLASFDVIGVAGNLRRSPNQPSWIFVNERLQMDRREHLSGAVAHGEAPFGRVSFYGPTPQSCELIDGMLMAARKDLLLQHQVRFDRQFDFHLYDMDFCRAARQNGLRIGTWPICTTHQSKGNFMSRQWLEKVDLYKRKWESAVGGSFQANGACP